jgi:hypothetical protein
MRSNRIGPIRYSRWNHLKTVSFEWTEALKLSRFCTDVYLAIGLTHSDYGVSGLEYGSYPLIVGVHIVRPEFVA